MTDPIIGSPLAGASAFESGSQTAAWSQAGLLASLGVQLTDDRDLLTEPPPGALRVSPLNRPFSRADAQQTLADEGAEFELIGSTVAATASLAQVQTRLWSRATTAPVAATLIYSSLASSHDIVRVVSAAEVIRLGQTTDPQAVGILAENCNSSINTIRSIAAHALLTVQPDHPALRRLTDHSGTTSRRNATAASLLVHGTFSRLGSTWWRPGGEFFNYVKTKVSHNLYAEPDGFRWTGRYSQSDRTMAAHDLISWLQHSGVDLDTVFAHSHGGNVVLDAAAMGGARMGLLILLSVPARRRKASEWSIIMRNVSRVFALRSHCDLVVLCDRSPQEYSSPVRTVILKGVWFSHHAVISPTVWERLGLAAEIQYERSLLGSLK